MMQICTLEYVKFSVAIEFCCFSMKMYALIQILIGIYCIRNFSKSYTGTGIRNGFLNSGLNFHKFHTAIVCV